MKFKVASTNFSAEKQPVVDAFEGIIVNATTLKALLKGVDDAVTLMLEEDEETISIWHPYDF